MAVQNTLYGRELSESEAALAYQPKSPVLTTLSVLPPAGDYLLSVNGGALTWAPTTGATPTAVATDPLTPSRVVITDTVGKISVSVVTVGELGYLSGVASNVQGQLAAITSGLDSLTTTTVTEGTNLYYTDTRVRAAITGAVSPILTANLTASRLLVSDMGGKVSTSNVTSVEAEYLSGVTSPIQTQLAELDTLSSTIANLTTTSVPEGSRLYFTAARATASITGAASTIATVDLPLSRALISDGNGKVATSPITATELSYVGGATSSLQGQIAAINTTVAGLTTTAVGEGTNLYHTPARVVSSLTGAVTTIATADLTVSRALVSTASGKVGVSSVTSTELGYLSGVTSAVQAQLNTITGRAITAGSGLSGGGTLAANLTLSVAYEGTAANMKMAGTAGVGTLATAARADHVHPTDTSRVGVSLLGTANGVATLDANTKVPPSQVPALTTQVGFGGEVITVPYTGSGITLPLPIAQGGTGTTNTASALSALGAQPTYPVLTSLHTTAGFGLVVKDTASTVVMRSIAVNNPLTITNAGGIDGNPTISIIHGHGSGLEADLLDGLHATSFLRIDGGVTHSSGTQTTIRDTIGAALRGTNADITSLSAITGIGNTTNTHITITTAGLVGMGDTSPNLYGKVAIRGGMAGTANSSLALLAPNGALNSRADLALYSTYSMGADVTARRVADIVAGYTGIAGTEYLSLHVGGATDARLLATERVRIDSAGNLLVGTTTTTTDGGDIQLSKGVTFPLIDIPSSNVSTLDDYREGTWVPTIDTAVPGTGRVTTVHYATFTKVGRLVTFSTHVTLATLGTGGSGNLVINGLPYTSTGGGSHWAVSVPYFITLKAAVTSLGATVQPNSKQVYFRGVPGAATSQTIFDYNTYVQAGSSFIVSGFYYTP